MAYLLEPSGLGSYLENKPRSFDNDIRLLCYALMSGETERLRDVLAEDAVCTTRYDGVLCGIDRIIEGLKDIHRLPKGQYLAYPAEVEEITSPELRYPVGTECIFLTDTEEKYVALVFISTDDEGYIKNIEVSPSYGNKIKIKIPPVEELFE